MRWFHLLDLSRERWFSWTIMIVASEGRKGVVVSISWPQVNIGDTHSWKLCLDLWSAKCLSPSRNLLSNFNPNCPWSGHIVSPSPSPLLVLWPLYFNRWSFEAHFIWLFLYFYIKYVTSKFFLIGWIIYPHWLVCQWPSMTVAYDGIVDSLLHRLGFGNWM